MIDAAAARLGSRFQGGATWQRRVHGAGRRSHYSYNEIIMTGALRPHHRNIYCIIYSASPLVQGERTHINSQARRSPPHSGCCLLGSRLASSLAFFPSLFSPRPSSGILCVFFLFCCCCCCFFPSCLPSRAQGRSISTAGPQHSCGLALLAPSVFILFFSSSLVFLLLLEQRTLFFFLKAKVRWIKFIVWTPSEFFFMTSISEEQEVGKGDLVSALAE